MIRRLALLLPLIALAGCDPISEDECRAGNWQERGFADGQAGRSVAVLEKYTEICGGFGITPMRDIYLAARTQGLGLYCTPANAYDIGRNGNRINAVCPVDQAKRMAPAFRKGARYHDLTEEMDAIDREISSLKAQLAEHFVGELTDVQRAEARGIRRDIRSLEHDKFRLSFDRRAYDGWP